MKRRSFVVAALNGAVGGFIGWFVGYNVKLRAKLWDGIVSARKDGLRLQVLCGSSFPPGARSVSRLTSRCSACGLCISSCPGKALRAAGVSSYGLAGMMMPRLDFENGYCSPDCHKCAEVCPAEAIERAESAGERARIRTGVAEWRHWECITRKGSSCGLCAGRCPNKAIKMVKDDGDEFAHPVVDLELCTGCGKCEHYCPAKPKAIVVKGVHWQEFAFGADTLVAYFNDGSEWSSQVQGVKPLLDAAADEALAAKFAGARCYARVVGRAAAFMFTKLRAKYIFAHWIHDNARKVLDRHGIECRSLPKLMVSGTSQIEVIDPVDAAVKDVADASVDDAVAAIRAALESTGKGG